MAMKYNRMICLQNRLAVTSFSSTDFRYINRFMKILSHCADTLPYQIKDYNYDDYNNSNYE